jgi:hypothetical protein
VRTRGAWWFVEVITMRTKLSLIGSLIFVLAPAAAFADDQPQQQQVVEAPKTEVVRPRDGGYVVPQSVLYEGGRIPEGASIAKKPNAVLIGAGLGIFGAAYLPSVITAIAACGPQSTCSSTGGAAWLYFPVVGPFITAALATSDGGRALAAFDGGIQLTGAAIAIAGLVAQKKFVVWQDKTAKVTVTPNAGANVAGISLTLTHL